MPAPKKRRKPALAQEVQSDEPLPEIEISGIQFNVEFVEVPDAAQRWERMLGHLGDWLVADWEREALGEETPRQH